MATGGEHSLPYQFSSAEWQINDPGDAGAIPADKSGIVELVSAAAETRTLAAPVSPFIFLLLTFKTDGGDITLTCSTTLNVTANNTITFDTAGECILLVSVPSGANYRWRALSCLPEADTATLSTV
jgi:hypothetical protein